MPRIVYRLDAVGTELEFQVLYMDERFRSLDEDKEFKASNGVTVVSSESPTISPYSEVYLRGGDRERDSWMSSEIFETVTECQEAERRIHAALKEWAELWPGWAEERDEDITVL